jgi:hypothetical protein
MDAKSLFQRSSRASCEGCRGGAVLSFGSAAVWSFAEFGDQMDGAVATAWRCFSGLLAWPDSLAASSASVMASETGHRSARSDPERSPATARRSGCCGRDWLNLAVLRPRGHQLQKKRCCPASRTGPTSRAEGQAGKGIRERLILHASSSLMRPGPRPTWSAPTAGD